jgi:hypothetical protein
MATADDSRPPRIAESWVIRNPATGLSAARCGTLCSGMVTRLIALVVSVTLVTGCFGYNKSAKRWAYVGDTVLVLAGGGVIALDLTSSSEPCMESQGTPRCRYEPPFSGMLVAGAVLAAAGLFGFVFNATRPYVKTTR